jgi:hypothetical protein
MTESNHKPRMVRHPSDLQRLLLALLVGVGGFLLATYLNTISEAITVEVINGTATFPVPVIIAVIVAIDVLTILLPLGVVGVLMWQRRWRMLGLAIVAAVSAQVIVFFVETEIVNRFASGDLPFTSPDWASPQIVEGC